MATERQPRNPYIAGLGLTGGIAGAVAVTLALIADLSTRALINLDENPVVADPVAIAYLFAWANFLGLVAIVAIAGALIIAGVRWTPKAPVTNALQPRLDGDLHPPGGLTDAERRVLDGDETR